MWRTISTFSRDIPHAVSREPRLPCKATGPSPPIVRYRFARRAAAGSGGNRGPAGDHRVRTRRKRHAAPRYDRRVSHPDPSAPADLAAIEPGEVWKNPVTGERAVVVELPWENTEGRGVAELTALPGARVMGEHLHPALHERFSVIEGELTVMREGRRSVL